MITLTACLIKTVRSPTDLLAMHMLELVVYVGEKHLSGRAGEVERPSHDQRMHIDDDKTLRRALNYQTSPANQLLEP